MRRWSFVLAVTLAASRATAHVSPSVDDNNRYLKVSPGADRVRLAYTVFFGDVPGGQLRPAMDTSHDGRISDAEGQAFGDKLAAEVAAGLELTVDGTTRPVRWTTVAAGMGTPSVAAGSFSLDLIAWACLPSARGRHRLHVSDRFRIPRPGETEVKVEDGPGITIHHARIGAAIPSDGANSFRFAGPGGPLADDGLEIEFTASDEAPLATDGRCPGAAPSTSAVPRGWIVGAAAVIAFVLAAIVAVLRRRRPTR